VSLATSSRVDTTQKVIMNPRLKHVIDLNTDVGQSRDVAFFRQTDYALLKYVSSVNVPCFVHDGAPKQVLEALHHAKLNHCVIGAHVGFPDPTQQGYSVQQLDDDELKTWLLIQLGALQAVLKPLHLDFEHIRPHGALYNAFLDNPTVAMTVAKTLFDYNHWAILVGPAGPLLKRVEEEIGIRTAPEVYLGRHYTEQGVPVMGEATAKSLHSNLVLEQLKQVLNDGTLTATNGQTLPVEAKTFHLSPQLDGVVSTAEHVYQLIGQPVALPVAAVTSTGWSHGLDQ